MPKKRFKVGQEVKMPYEHVASDVIQIVVETIDEVTGTVEKVKLIKADGKVEYKEVADVVLRALNFLEKLWRSIDKLIDALRKK